jgi:cell division protein FtsX
MIVWRAVFSTAGADELGASYHATKAEANKAIKNVGGGNVDKINILGREQAANALNEAIGYGGNAVMQSNIADSEL